MLMLAMLLQSVQPMTQSPPPPLHGGPQQTTCPVGGELFSAWQPSMYSTYGERPDGKPYSYLPLPFPIPECPSNKLVVFGKFSTDEITSLSQLISTIEYERLVASETTYYRAYWLATKLGRPEPEALGLLLSAIWQVSPGDMSAASTAESAAQFRRYQETFVSRVLHMGTDISVNDRLWLVARAANAARQLRKFDTAETLHRQAVASLENVTDKGGWDKYLTRLDAVIGRRDESIEPLDMIPDRQIAYVCAYRKPLNKFNGAICAKPGVAAEVVNLRK
jgi:hypothetical protein